MDGKVVIGIEADTSILDDQIAMLEDELEALYIEYDDIKNEKPYAAQKHDLMEYADKIDATTRKLEKLKQRRDELNGGISLGNILDGVSDSLSKIINKVVRWGLAVFGVRSAYNAIRSAMSVISQNDKQLAADIDYIKTALAYTLEPVVRKIVDLAKQLLFYIGYIIKAWTGHDIFAKANKSLAGTNKQAKALSKTLTGFDEMNVLSDNSSSSGGDGGVAGFSGMENMEVPGWIKWIADNKEIVLSLLAGIATGWALIKAIGFIDDLIDIGDALKPIGDFILKYGDKILGWGSILGGLALIIKGVIDYLKDPTWENFITILAGIALASVGVLVIFGGVPALITLIIGLVGALILAIVKNWDKIKETLSKVGTWIYDHIIKPVGDFFSGLWNKIKTGVTNFITAFKEKFQAVKDWIKTKIIDPIANFFGGMWNNIKTGASNGLNGVKSTFTNIINKIIDGINKFIRGLNKIQINIPDWLGGGTFGFNVKEIPRLARGGIVNNPGRGVMMGNYIAGESGAEAVLPLTDDTLQKLANMIPITINLTNTMNGRVISRELQKVQNNQDFAYNR